LNALKTLVNIVDEMSLTEIMNSIKSLEIRTLTISKIIDKKKIEIMELKISRNRLNAKIQKQS